MSKIQIKLVRSVIGTTPNQRKNVEALGLKKRESVVVKDCLLYTSPSPRDLSTSRMPSSA